VLIKLERYEDAIVAFDKAIKIQPEDPAPWSDKGEALHKLQRYEQAIATLDKAIRLNPKYTLAWYNKACCYAEQDRVQQAIQSLKQAIVLDAETTKKHARTDSSFDAIRKNPLFTELIGE
jgi:tetratricopeptide (TPR) repeat protein